MFTRVARGYDLANRVLSLGLDMAWRRHAAELTMASDAAMVLDVAAGTGDLALTLARRGARVIALDFCLPMMKIARNKANTSGLGQRIHFLQGDALALPFPDDTFSTVTSAFALRNLASIQQGIAEMARATRVGGQLVLLEMAKPQGPLRPLHSFYLHHLVPFVGYLLTGDREAYLYLPRSIDEFLTPQELLRLMAGYNLKQPRFTFLAGGAAAICTARKTKGSED
jgi:demethylmenaquinone methyltransferase/2-methoxy-6-polyprenyl-1,4-benzoquinol methylase